MVRVIDEIEPGDDREFANSKGRTLGNSHGERGCGKYGVMREERVRNETNEELNRLQTHKT